MQGKATVLFLPIEVYIFSALRFSVVLKLLKWMLAFYYTYLFEYYFNVSVEIQWFDLFYHLAFTIFFIVRKMHSDEKGIL